MSGFAIAVSLLAARTVTLEDAVKTARAQQPTVVQQRAQTEAARARADEARAPLLPQANITAGYTQATANFVLRPGTLPMGTTIMAPTFSLNTFGFWSGSATVSQLVWDFGQAWNRWRSARELARAQGDNEAFNEQLVALSVRTAFFGARAARALVDVAQQTLANYQRHLDQIQGFVTAGIRPEIDLAQARTDLANAKVQLINAENGYETAKAQLNQAMGVEGPTDFDVADEEMAPVADEDKPLDALLDEAVKARPDLQAIAAQIKSAEDLLRAAKGAYGPALSVTTGATAAGINLSELGYNLSAGLAVTWPVFNGLLTPAQVHEARANLAAFEAQRDLVRQQIRLELDQARLAVRAAKAATVAADEALVNARERLRLAEGRYQAGVGNAIELGDAQVALTQAAAQQVQSLYNLSIARAQLTKALGRI